MADRSAVRDVIRSVLEEFDAEDPDLEESLINELDELFYMYDDESELEEEA